MATDPVPVPAEGHVKARLEIPALPARVFELLSDPTRLPSWVDTVKAVSKDAQGWIVSYRRPDGPVECRCELRVDPAGLKVEWTARLPDGRKLQAAAGVEALEGGRSSCELTEDAPAGPAQAESLRRLETNLQKLSDLAQGKAAGAASSKAAKKPKSGRARKGS